MIKLIKRVILILIAFVLVYSGVVSYLIYSGTQMVPEQEADTMIILGAKVWGDQNNPRVSPVLKERLDAGIIYLNANQNTLVIVSGGQGDDEPISEAEMMARYLIENGIVESRIIKEDQSESTQENLLFSKDKKELGKTVVVSSDYHVYRALLFASRLKIEDVSGLPAESKTSVKNSNFIREFVALSYYLVTP